jgi:hypothetical protein
LANPKYGGYWLCTSGQRFVLHKAALADLPIDVADFSNILTKKQIEEMASADEFEVVKEVQVRAMAWYSNSPLLAERGLLHGFLGILRGLFTS